MQPRAAPLAQVKAAIATTGWTAVRIAHGLDSNGFGCGCLLDPARNDAHVALIRVPP
jgi:hypothetical protein